MTAQVEDFGERAATTAEASAWVTLVRAARTATIGYQPKPNKHDRMRPIYGSGQASSEADE